MAPNATREASNIHVRYRAELGVVDVLSPFIIFTSPDLFQEAAFFQIIDEAVIINFFRLFSNRGAAFAGEVDGFGDGFAWDDHRAVEDFPSVHVVGGL